MIRHLRSIISAHRENARLQAENTLLREELGNTMRDRDEAIGLAAYWEADSLEQVAIIAGRAG
jgi:regulator of replication initiation timing